MVKTTKDSEKASVITHAGIFHADEVLGTAILSKVLGDITVMRAFRIPENVGKEVIVFDIGLGELDHHQKCGNGTRENGVPYASAGLIWKKYGPQIVAGTCNPKLVWSLTDRDLIQGVDATDNGAIQITDSQIMPMSFSQMISGFNPSWDSDEEADDAFIRAVELAKIVLDNTLENAESKARAQKIVNEAIRRSEGHIMVLDQFVPWQEFIFSSNEEKATEIQFVIFPSNRGGFNWQCVPNTLGGFGQRKPVPTEWKGLQGEELQKVTGISTATFCHPAGFIGGAETFEGAYALAKKASE